MRLMQLAGLGAVALIVAMSATGALAQETSNAAAPSAASNRATDASVFEMGFKRGLPERPWRGLDAVSWNDGIARWMLTA